MIKRYYRSICAELNVLIRDLGRSLHRMKESQDTAMVPAGGRQKKTRQPKRCELKVDMNEDDSEVVILVNIIEGVTKNEISIDLINPQLLEISCKRLDEEKPENDQDHVTGDRFGFMTHLIPIIKPVTVEGSTAQFNDGILTIHLVKEMRKVNTKITID